MGSDIDTLILFKSHSSHNMFFFLNTLLAAGTVLVQFSVAMPYRLDGPEHHHHSHTSIATHSSTPTPIGNSSLVYSWPAMKPTSVKSTSTLAGAASHTAHSSIPPASPTVTPSNTAIASSVSAASVSATAAPTAIGDGGVWQPAVGATWQIELSNPVQDASLDVDVFDFDLFDNPASTITTLHSLGKKAICYFSAGTYEDWRSDAADFLPGDLGSAVDGWAGESWLDTNSANVRAIMTARIELAASKGCDGVDPDNVDGYDNDNELGLTTEDAVDYLAFLADAAHSRGLAIGLRNAGEIVDDVLPEMEWVVNEQCIQYDECNLFAPFITANKPVFHIEYTSGNTKSMSTESAAQDCAAPAGFSTVVKDIDLDAWVQTC